MLMKGIKGTSAKWTNKAIGNSSKALLDDWDLPERV